MFSIAPFTSTAPVWATSPTPRAPQRSANTGFGPTLLDTIELQAELEAHNNAAVGALLQGFSLNYSGEEGDSSPTATPDSIHMTQVYDETYNPNGAMTSADCGPTSLAMGLEYLGLNPDGSVQDKIDSARKGMGDPSRDGYDEDGNRLEEEHHTYTDVDDMRRSAQAAGATTYDVSTMDDLITHVSQGHPVVLGGQGAGSIYGSQNDVDYEGGHFITVSAYDPETGMFTINDPLSHKGPIKVTREQLGQFQCDGDGPIVDGIALENPDQKGQPRAQKPRPTSDGTEGPSGGSPRIEPVNPTPGADNLTPGDQEVAAQIDAYLESQGSPAAGTGALFVKYAQEYNVDPLILLAIAGHETGFGTLGVGLDGMLGVGAFDENPDNATTNPQWAGVERQLQAGAQTFAYWRDYYGVSADAPLDQQVAAVGQMWASDPAWADGIMRHYDQILQAQ